MLTDFLGSVIKVGDIVVRAKMSYFSLHRIVKITSHRIELSCYKAGKCGTHEYIVDSTKFKELEKHNHTVRLERTDSHKLIKI